LKRKPGLRSALRLIQGAGHRRLALGYSLVEKAHGPSFPRWQLRFLLAKANILGYELESMQPLGTPAMPGVTLFADIDIDIAARPSMLATLFRGISSCCRAHRFAAPAHGILARKGPISDLGSSR
jgi:hypothetical protein